MSALTCDGWGGLRYLTLPQVAGDVFCSIWFVERSVQITIVLADPAGGFAKLDGVTPQAAVSQVKRWARDVIDSHNTNEEV